MNAQYQVPSTKYQVPSRRGLLGTRYSLLGAWYSLIAAHWLLAIALVLGTLLRLTGLRRQSLWTDELYVVWEGRQPLDVIFNPMLHYQHPPGYRLALHVWMGVSTGETWIRLLPALAGIALIPVAWALARALWPGRPVAADASALLVATSPFLLHYSQDATAYSWTILWVTASSLALLHASRTNSRWAWAAWAASLTVALYSHYFAIFPLLAEVITVVCVGVWETRRAAPGPRLPSPQSSVLSPHKNRLGRALLALSAAILLYLPWIAVLVAHRDELGTPLFPLFWDGYPIVWIPQLLVGYAHTGLWQSPLVLLLIWGVFATGVILLVWRLAGCPPGSRCRRGAPGDLSALVGFLCGFFAIAGPYAAMRITTPPPGAYDWVRFTAFAAPALLLSLAGLAALLHPILRVLAVCAWLIMAGFQWQSEIASPPAQDWRGILGAVSAGAHEGDAFLAFTAFHAGAAASYYPVPLRVEGGWFTASGNDPTGAAYWFPPDWQWRGFLNPVAHPRSDWQTEITARTVGAGQLWYLAGDGADGTYPRGPAFEQALSSLGWHLKQEWNFSPLLLKLYARR